MPKALVIRAPGTNCDMEMCRAFSMAGAAVELVHLDALCADASVIGGFDLIGFPGGFSYGDDIASGRVFAMKIRERLYPHLRDAAARGCPMIGACNGFQVLVQTGLLPGPAAGAPWPDQPPAQTVALTDNKDARFHDRWVGMAYESSSVCLWTRGIDEGHDEQTRRLVHQLPVAHGEGRFVAADASTLEALAANGQIAARYTDNYNGSQEAIAGICDPSGRIFGLMPHPERFLDWTRHPFWTRLPESMRQGETPGLRMFRNAVEAASKAWRLAAVR
jgi:phosphoribosylformylglycinamidine synthase subunit PurQ / glutaminase